MNWKRVEQQLPDEDTEILMAWSEEGPIRQGKYFGKDGSLRGFATPSGKGAYWVGKIGVSHWCYLDEALPVREDKVEKCESDLNSSRSGTSLVIDLNQEILSRAAGYVLRMRESELVQGTYGFDGACIELLRILNVVGQISKWVQHD